MLVKAFRLLTVLLVASLALLGVTVANAAAPSYVALGDSYSSGVGAGDYGDSGGCQRSANAYPRLWADSHGVSDLQFVACLGASTDDVLGQADALSASTTLVTVSVGGNDAGFTDVMTETKRAAINSGADALAEVTAGRAASAGFAFADVRGPFTGHEICSADWWLHSVTWPVDESYHPNQNGQALGYLPALEAVTG